jgi:hypothetical protein
MRNYVLVFVMASALGACAASQHDGDEVGDGDDKGSDDTGDGSGDCIEGPCEEVPPEGDVTSPIDPACAASDPLNGSATAADLFVPKWTPLAPTVPNDCVQGFEMNQLEAYVHTLSSSAGSRAITLEVDIATYTVSDAIRIIAVDGAGNETILIDTCRLRTSEYRDPTGGTVRPPEDSIRDFRTMMPAGTRTLKIDQTYTDSPTYVRILGLCDFDLQPPPETKLVSSKFRIVSSR